MIGPLSIRYHDGCVIRHACPGPFQEMTAARIGRGEREVAVGYQFRMTLLEVRQCVDWVAWADARLAKLSA